MTQRPEPLTQSNSSGRSNVPSDHRQAVWQPSEDPDAVLFAITGTIVSGVVYSQVVLLFFLSREFIANPANVVVDPKSFVAGVISSVIVGGFSGACAGFAALLLHLLILTIEKTMGVSTPTVVRSGFIGGAAGLSCVLVVLMANPLGASGLGFPSALLLGPMLATVMGQVGGVAGSRWLTPNSRKSPTTPSGVPRFATRHLLGVTTLAALAVIITKWFGFGPTAYFWSAAWLLMQSVSLFAVVQLTRALTRP